MAEPWLHIVGIGEEGMAGLMPAVRAVVEAADVIVGGDRHHGLSAAVQAERVAWPSPFDALIDLLRSFKGRRVVVLATGDPLWYSVGARIGRSIDPAEIVYHPQLSAFQLAAARLGWSMADLETLTVHGRPVAQVIPFIQPGARLLILTTGEATPAEIAGLLTERGYGGSRMSVMAAMGGGNEARFDGVAECWNHAVPAFNTLAVECVAGPDALVAAHLPGLPDDLYHHDGTMTKQEVRAVTLARLMPMRGALLWDIGCGCGSVAVEWMRAARDARAVGIEPRADRRALAAANAQALGAPRLELIGGQAPDALDGLAAPDAVFIGGGLSRAVAERALDALKPLGRLVCNAVTLARLMPMRGALLWDIGCGCGSVAVEWMRAARDARAVGIEPRADRRALAAANAQALGAPRLELIGGQAPDALDGLAAPDAVFIGGGLSRAVAERALDALKPLGRLVCNAVTLESEAVLTELHKAHGGQLVKLAVSRAEPVGGLTGWKPLMPVTQWSLVKR